MQMRREPVEGPRMTRMEIVAETEEEKYYLALFWMNLRRDGVASLAIPNIIYMWRDNEKRKSKMG